MQGFGYTNVVHKEIGLSQGVGFIESGIKYFKALTRTDLEANHSKNNLCREVTAMK